MKGTFTAHPSGYTWISTSPELERVTRGRRGEASGEKPGQRDEPADERFHLELHATFNDTNRFLWAFGFHLYDENRTKHDFTLGASCSRALTDLSCPHEYDGCWMDLMQDSPLNISVSCSDSPVAIRAQDARAGPMRLCNHFVPSWGWLLSGFTLLTATLLLVMNSSCFGRIRDVRMNSFGTIRDAWHRSNYISCARSSCRGLFALVLVLVFAAFFLWLFTAPLRGPTFCSSFLLYPLITTCMPLLSMKDNWKDSSSALKDNWKALVLLSVYRLLFGAFAAFYILNGPCSTSSARTEYFEIEKIRVPLRKDAILSEQSIYPYTCILGTLLLWAPEGISRACSRVTLQQILSPPASTAPTAGHVLTQQPHGCAHKMGHQFKHVGATLVIVLVCLSVGVWDGLGFLDLFLILREHFFPRLRNQAWSVGITNVEPDIEQICENTSSRHDDEANSPRDG